MKIQSSFLNQKSDVDWLFETHLKDFKNIKNEVGSFEITGNEDCPLLIKTYWLQEPSIYDSGNYIFKLENGTYKQIES